MEAEWHKLREILSEAAGRYDNVNETTQRVLVYSGFNHYRAMLAVMDRLESGEPTETE